MDKRPRPALPLLICFIALTVAILLTGYVLKVAGVNYIVLMAANCLFFLVSLLVLRMQRKAMTNKNPNVFVRTVISGVMIKMFVCIAAVMAYVLLSGKYFNKPSVFISMVIYLVYLGVEVSVVMKLNKNKNA
jgi:hypothetical protein